jgi:hypothetical protein
VRKYLTFLVFALTFLSSLTGCVIARCYVDPVFRARYRPRISIVQIPSLDEKRFPSGRWLEFVIDVDEGQRVFRTLERVGDQLRMRTVTFDGRVAKTEFIPLFTAGYGGKSKYALSPAGNLLAYYDWRTKGLHLFDLRSSKSSHLMGQVGTTGFSLEAMEWISETEIVAVLLEDEEMGREGDTIIRLHVPTKTTRIIFCSEDLYPSEFTLSRSRRYLAIEDRREKHSLSGDVVVLDLSTDNVIATIENPERKLTGPLCWSPDESRLAYIKDDVIKTYSLKGGTEHTIAELPSDSICYELLFLDSNTLISIINDESYDRPRSSVVLVDIPSGEQTTCGKLASKGDTYVVDNGKRIICELGY